MADGVVAKSTLLRWWDSANWYLRVVIIWAATRVFTTAVFLITGYYQGESYWNGPRPGYFDFLNIWDVEWFWKIFTYGLGQLPGYPTDLPVSEDGYVEQNAWAFMPGWPLLVRAVHYVVPLDWKYLAPLLATLLSFGFALLAYRIFESRVAPATALWGVAWLGMVPGSPVLQAGYAESLGLVLLASGLLLILRERYLLALIPLTGLAFTRPGMVAIALALGLLWLIKCWKARRLQHWGLAAASLLSALLGFAWLIVAWIATGRLDAYPATELAWRIRESPDEHVTLLKGLWQAATLWWGAGFGTLLLVVLLLTALLLLLFTDAVKQLGLELRLWIGSYLLYLVLVFYPQFSTFRILLPAFALMAAAAHATRRWPTWAHWLIVVGLAVAQVWWVQVGWVYASPDYTPP